MLDSFDSDRHPDLQKAMKVIKCWFNNHLESGGGLILAGNYGCGKSHLARAVYEFYGYGAVYWNELDLIQTIQGGYSGRGRSQDEILTACRRARLLIYDDLGAYQTDNIPWLQNIYLRLFDQRKEDGAAIMITTNLALTKTRRVFDEIRDEWAEAAYSPIEDRLGGRLFSRVFGQLGSIEFYVNLFNVPDYRLRNL